MRAVLLVAALVALAGPALAEERVLYCTVTASAGFFWDEGQTEGRRTAFAETRYVVKVLSEEKRTITSSTGSTAGDTDELTCRKSLPYAQADLLVCDDVSGATPWLFAGTPQALIPLKRSFWRAHRSVTLA